MITVLGGNGFIGGHLVEALECRDVEYQTRSVDALPRLVEGYRESFALT